MFTQQEFDEKMNQFRQVLSSDYLDKLYLQKEGLEKQTVGLGFWDNPSQASSVSKEIADIDAEIKQIVSYTSLLADAEVAFELNEAEDLDKIIREIQSNYNQIETQKFLSGKFDSRDVILSVQAGAGGVDAQDFAAMLMAMYQNFAKKQTWTSELVSLSSGEEGGVKSATIKISGRYVYGLLKEEAGVHRLVRLSPFNSGNTRETSFAMVEVMPVGLDEEINIEIKEEDLSWDYFMASGKGGQSVNTTYSAVRVVHRPTNLSVSCQNERSQQQNKQVALKYLKNKLAILELKKQKDLAKELKGEFQSAQWGSQIRSYVNHPYKLVKDHRSGHESQNVEQILEGEEILDFIWAMKKLKVENGND